MPCNVCITRIWSCRSQHDDVRGRVVAAVQQSIMHMSSERQLECSVELRNQVAAVPCDVEIAEQLAAAAAAASPGATPSDVPRLVSGAGHDAMAMADITKVIKHSLFYRYFEWPDVTHPPPPPPSRCNESRQYHQDVN